MNILALLLKIFGSSVNLPDLLAQLASRLLEGVDDPSGCKEHLLQLIRSGTLDDKFKEDPLGTGICIAHVILALADKANPHVHAIGGQDDVWIGELAQAMKVTVPATGDNGKGALIEILITQLITKAIEMILARLKK